MTNYRILDGVPIPPTNRNGPRGSRWGFEDLEVNQCIEVDVGDGATDKLRAAANYYKATHEGWDYTSKRLMVGGKSVVRLWRVA